MLGIASSTTNQESNARSDQIAGRNERVFCNMILRPKNMSIFQTEGFPKELQ